MEKIVIDSCVFVKLFLDEADYEQARAFMKYVSEQEILQNPMSLTDPLAKALRSPFSARKILYKKDGYTQS